MTDFLGSLLGPAAAAGASLIYASFGAIYTERAGVLNLGVEGIMLTGACVGFFTAYATGSIAFALLCSCFAGAILGFLHAFFCVLMRAEQTVSGLALNVFCFGLTAFLGTDLIGKQAASLKAWPVPGLSQIPGIGPLFFQDPLVYGAYVLCPALMYLLRRTKLGLLTRAVGDDPATVDAMGYSVLWLRVFACVFGGALMGLGGAHLSLSYTPGWTEGLTSGRGWIAIALVVFSSWDPLKALLGAFIFGGVSAFQFRLQAMGVELSSAILNMLPYLATLFVLIVAKVFFKNSEFAPMMRGKPYFREER